MKNGYLGEFLQRNSVELFIPLVRDSQFQLMWYLSLILTEVINGTTLDLEGIQVCLNSLARVMMDG